MQLEEAIIEHKCSVLHTQIVNVATEWKRGLTTDNELKERMVQLVAQFLYFSLEVGDGTEE